VGTSAWRFFTRYACQPLITLADSWSTLRTGRWTIVAPAIACTGGRVPSAKRTMWLPCSMTRRASSAGLRRTTTLCTVGSSRLRRSGIAPSGSAIMRAASASLGTCVRQGSSTAWPGATVPIAASSAARDGAWMNSSASRNQTTSGLNTGTTLR
jgi:hypothetical protein